MTSESDPFTEDGTPHWPVIYERLSSPEGMEVRSYQASGRMLSYITARQVEDRLDAVVGPANWHDDYEIFHEPSMAVKCYLTVCGVTKTGIGYPNNPGSDKEQEPLKASESDGLKRSAVKFGIGRFLYADKQGTSTGAPRTSQHQTSAPGHPRAASADGQSKPASAGTIAFLTGLFGEIGIPIPNRGNLVSIPAQVANQWIDELKGFKRGGPVPTLAGWGDKSETVNPATGEITEPGPASPPQPRPATANQLSTIDKLRRLCGESASPEELDDWTSQQASAEITRLSTLYNEKKSQAGAR